MFLVLLLLPFFLCLSGMFLYRYSGKKQFLHFDLVQFVYAFLVYPLIYIWLKNFLYYLLRNELGAQITMPHWLVIDTFASVIFLYMYGFGIIHSLTKTFSLQMERDPFFDLFGQSEYFHEIISHVGMYVGGILVFTLLGIANTILPILVPENKMVLYTLLGLGMAAGILVYVGLFIMTDIESKKYKRLMRLMVALSFTMHVFCYFLIDPRFSISFGFYWFTFMLFSTAVLSFFFLSPTRRIGLFFQRQLKPQNEDRDDFDF